MDDIPKMLRALVGVEIISIEPLSRAVFEILLHRSEGRADYHRSSGRFS